MIVTEFTRSTLAYRREQRVMRKQGWIYHGEPIWQLVRGASRGVKIIDAKPGVDGKGVWLKLDGELKT